MSNLPPSISPIFEFAKESENPVMIDTGFHREEIIATHSKAIDYYRTLNEKAGLKRKIMGVLAQAYHPFPIFSLQQEYPDGDIVLTINELNSELLAYGISIVVKGQYAIIKSAKNGIMVMVSQKVANLLTNINCPNIKILNEKKSAESKEIEEIPGETSILSNSLKLLMKYCESKPEKLPVLTSEETDAEDLEILVQKLFGLFVKELFKHHIYLKHANSAEISKFESKIRHVMLTCEFKDAIDQIIEILADKSLATIIQFQKKMKIITKLNRVKNINLRAIVENCTEQWLDC